MEKQKRPNIFEYDNYRVFLGDLFQYLKSEKQKFSFRYFAREAGFRSPNFLQLVIEGKRNISMTSIEKFASVLKLNKEELSFFRNLVLINQSTTVEEKRFYAEQLIRSRLYRKVYPLKTAQYNYYSNWYFIPIRELVGLKGFREDPDWIAHQLIPPVTRSEAQKALLALEKLGLLKRDEAGQLKQTEAFVSTGDEIDLSLVSQFHKEMIRKGGEALDRFTFDKREISAVTVGLSPNRAHEVKELIRRFRKELLALASQDQNPSSVYQVNVQFFPLTLNHHDNEEKPSSIKEERENIL